MKEKKMNEIKSMYQEDTKMLIDIRQRFGMINEDDPSGCYKLAVDALQLYYRWPEIKCDIKKDLGRGEKAALKEWLSDQCVYLLEVYRMARMTWGKSKDDLRSNVYE